MLALRTGTYLTDESIESCQGISARYFVRLVWECQPAGAEAAQWEPRLSGWLLAFAWQVSRWETFLLRSIDNRMLASHVGCLSDCLSALALFKWCGRHATGELTL